MTRRIISQDQGSVTAIGEPVEPFEHLKPSTPASSGRLALVSDNDDLPARIPLHIEDSPLAVKEVALSQLVAWNQPSPRVFATGGGLLCRLRDTGANLTIELADKAILRHRLEEVVCWVGRRGEVPPPLHILEDLLALPDHAGRFPVLDQVVTCPVFAPDGTLVDTEGYSPAAQVCYDPRGLVVPPLPSIEEAKKLLNELFVDFPFDGPASRAHALALLLLPMARPLISGTTPLHLIEAPTIGSGKGLLSDMCLFPVTGGQTARISQCGDDDEWRKRITSLFAAGRQVVLVDNLNRTLDSGSLAAALTCEVWTDRVLGHTREISAANRAVWVATGNNPVLSEEMARRTVFIRLEPQVERPWQRTDFKHPDLRGWARAHRGELVAAGLSLVKAWLDAGRPLANIAFGDFNGWARAMGGILDLAGVPGFLANANERFDVAATELDELRRFVEGWWKDHQSAPVTAKELLVSSELSGTLPALGISDKDEHARVTTFGLWLARLDGKVLGDRQVKRLGLDRNKIRSWALVPPAGG